METIQSSLFEYFQESEGFTTQDAYKAVGNLDVNKESIRARIYEGIEKGIFEKLSKGVYKCVKKVDNNETVCLLINGNGRDLSMIKDGSVDGIITDHPYLLSASLKGGNRDFASYDLFRYEEKDFAEKCRVLKQGSFLVEFLPLENEQNYEYLYAIKKMAKDNGLKYYAKVPWIKGTFVSNTGRTAKNAEDVMIFSKGEPRTLKLDAKKNIAEAQAHNLDVAGLNSKEIQNMLINNNLTVHYMKGTNGMLPTDFNFQPKPVKEKVMEAEKPVELLETIIDYITLPDELLLDQFAGSHNLVLAALNKKRRVITFESDINIYDKACKYLEKNLAPEFVFEN